MRPNYTKPEQPKGPSMPASHTHHSIERQPLDSNHQVLSIFKSHQSPEQRAADANRIAGLIGPGVMQHYSHNGETKLEKEKIFVPSLTHLEPIAAEQGKPTYEIAGGWLTRQEAILMQSETASVVTELPINQPSEQAA